MAQDFDQNWNRVAGQLGFNPGSNMLEYGGGQNNYAQHYNARGGGGGGGQRNNGFAEARGLGVPESYAEQRGLGYVDDGRRGHYIPDQTRG